jgi:uncharacterized protein
MVKGNLFSPDELKIVFTGPMGAGKTTAISAVSDHCGLNTEVPISDGFCGAKTQTTVGFDYGECLLEDGTPLRLFGTPGQERFRFMWDILGKGAFGLIVLADNTRPDPIADVEQYLDAFSSHVPKCRTVIGVGRLADRPEPDTDQYFERLSQRGFDIPVLDIDAREPSDVRLLLSVLISLAETEDE